MWLLYREIYLQLLKSIKIFQILKKKKRKWKIKEPVVKTSKSPKKIIKKKMMIQSQEIIEKKKNITTQQRNIYTTEKYKR